MTWHHIILYKHKPSSHYCAVTQCKQVMLRVHDIGNAQQEMKCRSSVELVKRHSSRVFAFEIQVRMNRALFRQIINLNAIYPINFGSNIHINLLLFWICLFFSLSFVRSPIACRALVSLATCLATMCSYNLQWLATAQTQFKSLNGRTEKNRCFFFFWRALTIGFCFISLPVCVSARQRGGRWWAVAMRREVCSWKFILRSVLFGCNLITFNWNAHSYLCDVNFRRSWREMKKKTHAMTLSDVPMWNNDETTGAT